MRHLSERGGFGSGIVWVSLRAVNSAEAVTAAVLRALANASDEFSGLELSGAGIPTRGVRQCSAVYTSALCGTIVLCKFGC